MGQSGNNLQTAINRVCLQVFKGYTVMEFKDFTEEFVILPRPEKNFIGNSICFRGAITWNTLTNKETRDKTLKEFKCCLVRFDTDIMKFEPILATTKTRHYGAYTSASWLWN